MKIVEFQGGLGNQMFIYSFYKCLKFQGYESKADLNFYNQTDGKYNLHDGFELNKVFNLKLNMATPDEIDDVRDNLPLKRYRNKLGLLANGNFIENISRFNAEVFDEKYIYYSGYFQDERYFEEIKQEIRDTFTFKKTINMGEGSVSIHLRRTDFIGNPLLGGVADTNYYQSAISYISSKVKNPKFYIFSDDIEWCKENFKIDFPHKFIDHTGNESYKDMLMMSKCEHNIIVNSSFSWWGAWLNNNPDKIVICPEKYYKNRDKTPYLEGWIRL